MKRSSFHNVAILGVAHVDAPHRVTSSELQDALTDTFARLGLPANLIENLTGVRARRFWDPGTQPSDAATWAGRKVLDETGIAPAQIGALINTSVCKDYVEPSVACFVHHNLGLAETCGNFDISNACLGFLDGMQLLATLIERGDIEYGLVVDAESSRQVVERTIERMRGPACDAQMMRQQLATLTTGSGAAAMVLGRADRAPEAHRYLGSVSLAATRHNQLCRGQWDQGVTDTAGLLKNGVALAARTWQQAQEQFDWSSESVDLFALHQVSQLHTKELARALAFDVARAFLIYPEFGNVGPASVPMVLSKALEAGRVNAGDRVVLGGIGSGLNCTAAAVLW